MDFYDIISRCGPDTIEKRRVFEPTFAELLIRNEHVDTWHNGCRAFLGEPVKPADTPASDHTTAISKDYGGARSGQTLYVYHGTTGAYGLVVRAGNQGPAAVAIGNRAADNDARIWFRDPHPGREHRLALFTWYRNEAKVRRQHPPSDCVP